MKTNITDDDWFKLDQLQRLMVQIYGYESEMWFYVRSLKDLTPCEIKHREKLKVETAKREII